MRKNRFRDIRFKLRLKHFESIPNKTILEASQLFGYFGQKNDKVHGKIL